MSKFSLSTLLYFLSIIFLFQSCIKDYDFDKIAATEWSPEFAIPLLHSKLSMEDILNDEDSLSYTLADSTGLLSIYYTTTVFTIKAEDRISLSNNESKYVLGLTDLERLALETLNQLSITQNEIYTLELPLDDGDSVNNIPPATPEIKTVKLNSGTLYYRIICEPGIPISCKFECPDFKNSSGASLTDSQNFNGGDIVFKYIDISDYTFDLSKAGLKNSFNFNYSVNISNDGSKIQSIDSIRCEVKVANMRFKELTGYLGHWLFPTELDSINVHIFKSNIEGNIHFEEPTIRLLVHNYFGIGVRADFVHLVGSTPNGGFPITYNTQKPTFQILPAYNVGDFTTSEFVFNNTNSNINKLIEEKPRYILYQVNGMTNPIATDTNNFITDKSKLAVELEVELPMFGTARGFVLQDTVPLDGDIIKELEYAIFKSQIINWFPTDVALQIYFADSGYVILDSMFDSYQQVFRSPVMPDDFNNFRVINPTEYSFHVAFNKEKLINVGQTKYLLVRGMINTTKDGTENVKIYSDYSLDIRIGVEAKIKIGIN